MKKLLLFLIFAIVFVPVPARADEISVPAVETYAGTRGSALFNLPFGVAGDDGRLFVADTYNNLIRTVDADGGTAIFAGRIMEMDEYRFPSGHYLNSTLKRALFNRPSGVARGGDGRLFVSDSANNAIRVISGNRVRTYSGGGKPGHADGDAALFNYPTGIAADVGNNLYVADTLNHCIRKIDANGLVTTVAGVPETFGLEDGLAEEALFNAPMGIAVSEDGRKIYVADTGNHRIRLIQDGEVTTYAGVTNLVDQDGEPWGEFLDGPNAEAMFNLPTGLALYGGGLVVADSGNNRIRLVSETEVTTLAGTGEPGADDGEPLLASFNLPSGVCVYEGILYIADTGNNAIRKLQLEP